MIPFGENSYNQGYNDGFDGKYDYSRNEDRAYNAGFNAGYFKCNGIPKDKDKQSVLEANRQVEEYKDNSYYADKLFGNVNFTTVKLTALLKAILAIIVITIFSFVSGSDDSLKNKNNTPDKINNTYQQEELHYSPTAQKPNDTLEEQENASKDTLTQADWEPYMRELQKRIKMNWTPVKGSEEHTVGVRFKVAKDGRLLSYEIQKSSGITEVDKAAVQAIQFAAPFRPLPEGFKEDSVDIQFTFDYHKIQ